MSTNAIMAEKDRPPADLALRVATPSDASLHDRS
jgi:hypothetical protein